MKSPVSRRDWVQSLCGGFGAVGLAGMLAQQEALAASAGKRLGPHFAPKAKNVIFLFMTGGPSQVDLFDPKPALAKYAGQRPPSAGLRTERTTGGLLPSPFAFKQYGANGLDVSEVIPEIASVADELCVIRSMHTPNPTHESARNMIHSGHISSLRPTLGSWISYGLGSENQNLPGFVTLSPGGGGFSSAGFLPAEYQGTRLDQTLGDPDKMVRYLRNPEIDPKAQRKQLDFIQQLNRTHEESFGPDSFLDGRIQAMESAYRMQFEAMDVFDLKKEPESMRDAYGRTPFANGCLLARRMVERGVRYVHLYYGPGQPWDDHKDINANMRKRCPDMDRATAALIRDLKQRGLLDETLVVWGGEFGRTPVSESGDGRDHNPYGFTMFMAGGGSKRGVIHGATDEFGFKAVENRMSIHDLHATVLHLMGVDHERLTYRYAGRDFRLTDVFGQVIKELVS